MMSSSNNNNNLSIESVDSFELESSGFGCGDVARFLYRVMYFSLGCVALWSSYSLTREFLLAMPPEFRVQLAESIRLSILWLLDAVFKISFLAHFGLTWSWNQAVQVYKSPEQSTQYVIHVSVLLAQFLYVSALFVYGAYMIRLSWIARRIDKAVFKPLINANAFAISIRAKAPDTTGGVITESAYASSPVFYPVGLNDCIRSIVSFMIGDDHVAYGFLVRSESDNYYIVTTAHTLSRGSDLLKEYSIANLRGLAAPLKVLVSGAVKIYKRRDVMLIPVHQKITGSLALKAMPLAKPRVGGQIAKMYVRTPSGWAECVSTISTFVGNVLQHIFPTKVGMSGLPIFQVIGNKVFVVAIHQTKDGRKVYTSDVKDGVVKVSLKRCRVNSAYSLGGLDSQFKSFYLSNRLFPTITESSTTLDDISYQDCWSDSDDESVASFDADDDTSDASDYGHHMAARHQARFVEEDPVLDMDFSIPVETFMEQDNNDQWGRDDDAYGRNTEGPVDGGESSPLASASAAFPPPTHLKDTTTTNDSNKTPALKGKGPKVPQPKPSSPGAPAQATPIQLTESTQDPLMVLANKAISEPSSVEELKYLCLKVGELLSTLNTAAQEPQRRSTQSVLSRLKSKLRAMDSTHIVAPSTSASAKKSPEKPSAPAPSTAKSNSKSKKAESRKEPGSSSVPPSAPSVPPKDRPSSNKPQPKNSLSSKTSSTPQKEVKPKETPCSMASASASHSQVDPDTLNKILLTFSLEELARRKESLSRASGKKEPEMSSGSGPVSASSAGQVPATH